MLDDKGELFAQDNDPGTRNLPGEYKYDAPEVWAESIVDLPASTPISNFSQYQTRSQTGFKFYVDVSSIKFGSDGVVSMSLLAVSAKGSENITYEGFRCKTGEYKLYASRWAFDDAWIPAKRASWRAINPKTPNSYRSDLMEYYICNGTLSYLDEKGLKALLKRGKMNKPGGLREREFTH
ncbi:CNP1-like family protein [Burkholderiales bacterium]|nr:CNP1-like family protein [Burkholderiales bacterium]